ncbi:MAG TPA: ABC transporter permease subunit [Pseudonocardiaceae bacterium]|jgi:ABC-type transport system involved in multi-copper enzyme maturation permease subunit
MSTDTISPATGPARHALHADLPSDLRVTQWGVIRSEWLKFWSLRSSQYSMIIAVVAMIGLDCLFAYASVSRYNQQQALHPGVAVHFSATDTAMRGYLLVQLVVGVLGVLVVSGEYGTGMIRSSLAAAPKRLPVLWAKAIVLAVIVFVATTISSFIAYFAVQPILNSAGLGYALTSPGMLRAVFGVGLYVTGVGLLGAGLGWILRHTAGAIASLFGLLLILPSVSELLPDTWQPHIVPYLPSNAGTQLATASPDPGGLAPWTGFGVFCVWIVVAIVLGVVVLRGRDA